MRVEKIASNKVRIFISYEDLASRGIDREDMWQNGKKVQELFWDMMEVAYSEVGFEIVGPIAVETFTMPSEGVVVIVTQVPSLPVHGSEQDVVETDEAGPDPFGAFVFAFIDFDDVVHVAESLMRFGPMHCSLYHYKGVYHLYFDDASIDENVYEAVWAVLQEFGELVQVTRAVLDEYGKLIVDQQAIDVLNRWFAR